MHVPEGLHCQLLPSVIGRPVRAPTSRGGSVRKLRRPGWTELQKVVSTTRVSLVPADEDIKAFHHSLSFRGRLVFRWLRPFSVSPTPFPGWTRPAPYSRAPTADRNGPAVPTTP